MKSHFVTESEQVDKDTLVAELRFEHQGHTPREEKRMKKAWNKVSRVVSALLVLGMFASVVPAQVLAVDEPDSQVAEQQDEEQTSQSEIQKQETGSNKEQDDSEKTATGSEEEQVGAAKDNQADMVENLESPENQLQNGDAEPASNKLYTITNESEDVTVYCVYAFYYNVFGFKVPVYETKTLKPGESFSTNIAYDYASTLMVFFKEEEGYTSTVDFSEEAEGNVLSLYDENFPTQPATTDGMAYDFTSDIEQAKKDGYNKGFFYTYWSAYPFECGERWFKISLTKDGTPDPDPTTEYTLVYYANNGTDNKTTDTKTAGENFVVADISWTFTDHVFTGWNTEPNGEGKAYKVGETIPATANVELYAQWEEITEPTPTKVGYTVNYYKDSVAESNLLDTESGTGNVGDKIEYTPGAYLPEGYTASNPIISGAETIGADETKNVLNVVYNRRTDLKYTVNYYKIRTVWQTATWYSLWMGRELSRMLFPIPPVRICRTATPAAT